MKIPSPIKRLRSTTAAFVRSDDGSATVWNLTWLAGFAIMAGLAMDSTNAWRHKTMLASTADVAALAGAWDLPYDYEEVEYATGDFSAIEASALEYAAKNMDKAVYGDRFIEGGDIYVGNWNKASRTFTPGMDPVNAVRTLTYQNRDRNNSIQTTLLRFLSIYDLQADGEAIAVLGIDSCIRNGIISREKLFIRSNAKLIGDHCKHGQLGVNIRPNAEWTNPESITTGDSPPGVVGDWAIAPNQYELNPDGTRGDVIDMSQKNTTDLYPPMVDQIVEIGYSALAGFEHYRHFTYPAQPQNVLLPDPPQIWTVPDNMATVLNTIPVPQVEGTVEGTGLGDQTWWRMDDGVQVASLDGFASVAALIGLSQSTGGDIVYHDTQTYGEVDQKGNSDNFAWEFDKNAKISLTPASNFDANKDPLVIKTGGGTTGAFTEERIYFVNKCQSDILRLSGLIRNVSIITNCKIDITNGTIVENAFLLTTATGSQAVQISNGTRIGAMTGCEGWGGVMIMSNGDIRATGTGNGTPPDQYDEDAGISQYWGAFLVARDEIHFAAKSDSEKGITMYAGGPINIAAQAQIGALELPVEPTPEEIAACKEGVGGAFDRFAYTVGLVH